MEDLTFPQQQILDFLKGNLDMGNLTIQDLKSPTAAMVQTVYVRFLDEVGFNTDSMLMPSMELLDSLDHPDILKEMIPTLSLQAGCSYLIQRLVGDTSFGIMDLLRPSARRTQGFMSVLQNFWLFCNQRVSQTDEVQTQVEKLVMEKAKLENAIEEYKTRINRSRSKAVEDRANEEALLEEIDHLKKRLDGLTPKTEQLNREKIILGEEMAKVTAVTEEMEAKKLRIQSEMDSLQGVFEGAAILHRLDQELAEIADSLDAKEKRKLEFRNNLEVLDRTKEEYNSVLELVKQISKEEEKAREMTGKIREQLGQVDVIKMELEELESDLKEAQDGVANMTIEANKVKLQWNRRKKGKEEEIDSAMAAREEARQKVGEDQLTAIELTNKLRDIGLMEEEEREQMAVEAARIRQSYSKILESMEKFNKKITSDFTKLEKAQEKMNTPSIF